MSGGGGAASLVPNFPVYDYRETGYIGNMQLPPRTHQYYTHIDGDLSKYALLSFMSKESIDEYFNPLSVIYSES